VAQSPVTKLFFCTDIHGSERCFRKFINAGKFYRADVLIMGGDITGKVVIPLVRDGQMWSAWYMGRKVQVETEAELVSLEKDIRYNGYYPYRTVPEEVTELETDEGKKNRLFSTLIVRTLESWLEWAESRLQGTGVRCFVTPGNDDILEIDEVLQSSSAIVNPEGRCVDLNGYHFMVSSGYSNPTPWNSPRECHEDELATRLRRAVAGHEGDMDRMVLNSHVPPYDTVLDLAPELTSDRSVKQVMGQPLMAPVGSRAVRAFIEEYQPILGLHGHIHESKGRCQIGRTACVNPGSEYTEGVLRGVLVTLAPGTVRQVQFLSG